MNYYSRLADFFFVGLGVLPFTLLLSGYPELVVTLFVPLLLTACLFGIMGELEEAGKNARADEEADGPSEPEDSPGMTFRKHDPGK